jgi:hypothetical protein
VCKLLSLLIKGLYSGFKEPVIEMNRITIINRCSEKIFIGNKLVSEIIKTFKAKTQIKPIIINAVFFMSKIISKFLF